MIDKIVTLYRKAKMGVISEMSGATAGVLDETSFYDVGYMQSQISRIQKEFARVSKELEISIELKEDSDYARKKRQELIAQREYLLVHMVFLASNSFSNLKDCVKMAEGHNIGFMDCVKGLLFYKNGEKDKAFCSLEEYFRKYGSIEEHFLANKVFGTLLADKGQYEKAIPFLTYAQQFMPEDTEILTTLKKCFMKNDKRRAAIIEDIMSVLA
ncbi:MAG: hypothetical protein ABGU93_08065 [Acetobacterium sp.]|uniref:tetratricopeptide repeat protein n=1 Tax=Acetobacterium sp. TaxID=1872094 RepID=UPI0032423C76